MAPFSSRLARMNPRHAEFVHRADYSHIWVTPDALAVGKPFAVLGEMSFSEAVTSDSIDEAKITEKLKTMAFAK